MACQLILRLSSIYVPGHRFSGAFGRLPFKSLTVTSKATVGLRRRSVIRTQCEPLAGQWVPIRWRLSCRVIVSSVAMEGSAVMRAGCTGNGNCLPWSEKLKTFERSRKLRTERTEAGVLTIDVLMARGIAGICVVYCKERLR